MATPRPSDGMPTTRGMNFHLADPDLRFVCASVMAADDFERAHPHPIAMGGVAGGELDARPVAGALDHALAGAPASVFTAPALVDWTPILADALAADAG